MENFGERHSCVTSRSRASRACATPAAAPRAAAARTGSLPSPNSRSPLATRRPPITGVPNSMMCVNACDGTTPDANIGARPCFGPRARRGPTVRRIGARERAQDLGVDLPAKLPRPARSSTSSTTTSAARQALWMSSPVGAIVVVVADRRRRRTADLRRGGIADRRRELREQRANGRIGESLVAEAHVERLDCVGDRRSIECTKRTQPVSGCAHERPFPPATGQRTPATVQELRKKRCAADAGSGARKRTGAGREAVQGREERLGTPAERPEALRPRFGRAPREFPPAPAAQRSRRARPTPSWAARHRASCA